MIGILFLSLLFAFLLSTRLICIQKFVNPANAVGYVITIKRAYEELEQEGMIYSVPGKGFYVDNPDREYLEEKRAFGVEEELVSILDKCRQSGLSKEDVREMLEFPGHWKILLNWRNMWMIWIRK